MHHIKTGLFFFLCCMLSAYAEAQNKDDSTMQGNILPANHIEILADSRIDSLVRLHARLGEQTQTMPGYRVQIYFGVKAKALEIKSQFLLQYPETGAYLSYQQPNFRVRVGDFRTRLEAYKFYKEIASAFEVAFIVKDQIALPPLK